MLEMIKDLSLANNLLPEDLTGRSIKKKPGQEEVPMDIDYVIYVEREQI